MKAKRSQQENQKAPRKPQPAKVNFSVMYGGKTL